MYKLKCLNCLLGGAIGDALGAPVEFLPLDEIIEKFGPQGLTDYAPSYHRLGAITDDTQMTLFTANGLLSSYVQKDLKDFVSIARTTKLAYKHWLYTQEHPYSQDLPAGINLKGPLSNAADLYHRRAPGRTCISALKSDSSLTSNDSAINDRKGCGGVMRIAPVGLLVTIYDAFQTGVEIAAITHGHPSGQLPAGVLAAVIRYLYEGLELPKALNQAITRLKTYKAHEETLNALNLAIKLACDRSVTPIKAISLIGQGWVAEEALAISIYCALNAKDFRQGVLMAVNHDGDSDSTGAIAGNVLGLIYGLDSAPSNWLENLELREVISELAEDLCDAPNWKINAQLAQPYPDDDLAWRKYL
ncbi:MAG: ADP-ribosylglycohydrolase family protein [Deltaproteobacteria bacterium]|jgi:ADP-ribosylglycohydrolase|nr:ADP-ribosylglycohydrolase family protein [Deltaproteobacteria bacterium]